jgi:hypothetical protein
LIGARPEWTRSCLAICSPTELANTGQRRIDRQSVAAIIKTIRPIRGRASPEMSAKRFPDIQANAPRSPCHHGWIPLERLF